MVEKHIEEVRKLIPQKKYFDATTAAFLKKGMDFCYHNRNQTLNEEGLQLAAMPIIGNSVTFLFTDSENNKWVIKESTADINRFFLLPEKIRAHHRINPIDKVSPSLEFHASPFIEGFEGGVIYENFEPDVYAEEWVNLLTETSEAGIIFDDIKPAEGHNLFWDLHKKEFVLFDHGSFSYDAQLDNNHYLIEHIRKLFTSLHSIFHYWGYSRSLHYFNGEVMLNQSFIHKLQTEYLVIAALIKHLDLNYLPATKRNIVEVDIRADMSADFPPKWEKQSQIENDNKRIPNSFKDFLKLVVAEIKHNDIKMRDEHLVVEGKKISFYGQDAVRAFEKYIETID